MRIQCVVNKHITSDREHIVSVKKEKDCGLTSFLTFKLNHDFSLNLIRVLYCLHLTTHRTLVCAVSILPFVRQQSYGNITFGRSKQHVFLCSEGNKTYQIVLIPEFLTLLTASGSASSSACLNKKNTIAP